MELNVTETSVQSAPLWTDRVSALVLCFSQWENGTVCGELWSFYAREPWQFRGLDQMLFAMEEALDTAGRQDAWCRRRTLEAEAPLPSGVIPPEPCWRPNELMQKRGKLCTAVVRIYYRRNASFQGELKLSDRVEAIRFRSALELMHLLWSALGGA